MTSPSASSFDLGLAGALSRALREPPAATPANALRRVEYVEFRASRFWAGTEPAAARTPTREVEIDLVREGLHDWTTLLDWCLKTAAASSVFVMDWQGFLIENRGSARFDDVEAMGTQLMVTLEQADRMDLGGRLALAVEASFEGFRVTGVRVPPGRKESITLGILGTAPLAPEVIAALTRQVELSLPHL